ncbi:hypothetical protein OX283_014720 [Flavobacterium sp. SUN052]|uniref:hypothetical protein n=1 Tax=Flavobacterium sp. SUN052 TaxID=3002441 RepID=UPI00237DB278|nr:hypothetical protein [Flavobacterium sp. SUN052]MEC4005920.1 hypothetical protein [Flavobacterium sp. SUN052]
MKTNSQNTATNFLSENKKGLVLLFILFLLSSVGMFGQTKNETVAPQVTPVIEISIVPAQAVALDSDTDFMNWFMGSKQTQTVQDNTANVGSTTSSRKKQIISSGVTPNKVLYRTFMKKVISQESAIA